MGECKLWYYSDDGLKEYVTPASAIQGSVMDRLLWHITKNEILNLPLEGVVYADDIALVVVVKHLGDALSAVKVWFKSSRLSLAEEIMEAVLIIQPSHTGE